MKRLWLALFLCLGITQAFGQSNFKMPPPAGVVVNGVQVVAACGSGTLVTTQPGYMVEDTTGKLCINATVSATVSGTLATSPVVVTPISTTQTIIVSCNAGCSGSGGGETNYALETSGNLASILAAVQGSIPAGTANIGQVGGSINITPTDCSVAITTGGTAQSIIAANAALHGFSIANIDTSTGSGEPVWMSFTTTASANTLASYPLAAPTATTFASLSSYTTPVGFGTNHAVSVIAATTGHKISCTYW